MYEKRVSNLNMGGARELTRSGLTDLVMKAGEKGSLNSRGYFQQTDRDVMRERVVVEIMKFRE